MQKVNWYISSIYLFSTCCTKWDVEFSESGFPHAKIIDLHVKKGTRTLKKAGFWPICLEIDQHKVWMIISSVFVDQTS